MAEDTNVNRLLSPFSAPDVQFSPTILAEDAAEAAIDLSNINIPEPIIPVDVVNAAAPYYPAGKWVPVYAGNSATSTNFVNNGTNRGNIYWCLAVLPNDTKIDQMAVRCVVTNATNLVRLGIYSDVNGVPTKLIVDAGTVTITSSTANSVASITPITLEAGRYWLAVAFQAAATSTGAITGFTAGYTAPLYRYADSALSALGSGATNPCFYTTGSAYASGGLPASTTGIIFVDTPGTGLTSGPLVTMRAA